MRRQVFQDHLEAVIADLDGAMAAWARITRSMARKRRVSPGGTRATVFREVARIRRDDGAVLFEARRYRGALYLGGYAIECLLKWAATRRHGLTYLPAEHWINEHTL